MKGVEKKVLALEKKVNHLRMLSARKDVSMEYNKQFNWQLMWL